METIINIGNNYINIKKKSKCIDLNTKQFLNIVLYFINDNTVAIYSGHINLIYFIYELKKLGIKNLILDIKGNKASIIPYLIKGLQKQFKTKSNFNLKNYLDEYLDIQPYLSTNNSNMNLCELDISKLKLRDLNR